MQLESRRVLLAVSAVVLVGVAGGISMSAGYPTLYRPLSLTVVVPALYIVGVGPVSHPVLFFLSSLPIALVFAVWSWRLFTGEPRVPVRSVLLFAALLCVVAYYFAIGWKFGLEYQGLNHTVGVALINGAWVLALSALRWRARKSPSFGASLSFHAAMFAWLAWYAFPWLGELL